MTYTLEQIEELLNDERTSDALYQGINDAIDNALIYDEDIKEELNKYTSIVDVLNGKYTMENLFEDMRNDLLDNEEEMNDIINDYLDIDLVNEVLGIDEEN